MPLYEHKGRRPFVGEAVYVAPNATIVGDVVLGAESSVWFGAVVRGDVFPIRIGKRSNIQDNAVLHVTNGKSATTLGDEVTVGHMALLHGCTIGNRCLVGMGSIVLDDAVVGDECVIAAGALVTPRMRIPPRSVVMGRPAKVVRAATNADLEQILEAASNYVAYSADYASAVRAVE